MARNPRLPSFPSDVSHAVFALQTAVQAIAFWTAALLPLALVALLLLVDRGRTVDVDIVAGLVAINVVACILGHEYDPSQTR